MTLATAAWSGNRQLDSIGAVAVPQARLQLRLKPHEGVAMVFEGTLAQERPLAGGAVRDVAVLHEAYVGLRQGSATLRVGPQIIRWGRADGLNPTDVVSAQDYTQLVADDAQQVQGLPSASLSYRYGWATAQLVWQPSFTPSTLPLPVLAGLRTVREKPQGLAGSGGMRVDASGERWAGALSFFRGPSKRPSPVLGPAQLAQGMILLRHPRSTMLGVDGEWITGHWVLRGEAAMYRFEGSGEDVFGSRESNAQGVLGVERDFGIWSAFLMVHGRRGLDHVKFDELSGSARDAALFNAVVNEELRRSEWGLGSGLSYVTQDLRTQARMEWLWNAAVGDWIVRPRLRVALSDQLSLWAGMDWFSGAPTSTLGRLRANRSTFVGLAYDLGD